MFRQQGNGGKGDSPRPIPNREKFESNWDNIFKKKKDEQRSPPSQNENNVGGNAKG